MYQYIVNGDVYTEDEIDDLLRDIVTGDYYYEQDDDFRDYVNENENQVEIMGYRFDAADVLYEMNEDGYFEAKSNWADGEVDYWRGEYRDTINRMTDGDEEYICGETVRCEEIDEDEDDDGEDDEDERAKQDYDAALAEVRRLAAVRKAEEEAKAKEWFTVYNV